MSADEAVATLDRRLNQQFPVSTSEADLMRGLVADGFSRSGKANSPCDTSRCVFVQWRPDKTTWIAYTVNWETDAKGRVTDMRSERLMF